jgi:DnaJ family protein B protein 12
MFFNLGGGGPGIRVHRFGGARPRARPREANANAQPQNLSSTIMGLLPLLILFIFPLLSSLFSGSDSTSKGPQVQFSGPKEPYTLHRVTSELKVDYFVNPVEVKDYSASKLHTLDKSVEAYRVSELNVQCSNEIQRQNMLMQEAQGWFFQDETKMNFARNMKLEACDQLRKWGKIR